MERIAGLPVKTIQLLKKGRIQSVRDLAELFPRKYIDYRSIRNIQDVADGECAAVSGVLLKVDSKSTKDHTKQYLSLRIRQSDGICFSVLVFGNTRLFGFYLQMEKHEVVICGKVTNTPPYGYILSNPDEILLASSFEPHIRKVYKKFKGISDQMLQKGIREAVYLAEEPFEPEVLQAFRLPGYRDSLYQIHNSNDTAVIRAGKKRISVNDMTYLAMCLEKNREMVKTEAPGIQETDMTKAFLQDLPFRLTKDQNEAVRVFWEHASQKQCSSMLLQGDVGCGKTIVAACCMMLMAENGYQSILMAPRSVLAKQHFEEIREYAQKIGQECVFLHSGMKAKEKKEALEKIHTGEARLIVGTHSCLAEEVQYHNLALVVTDEEHLFGVDQKQAIDQKALPGYHRISMSATPIPRSIANVLYGGIYEIQTIRTKPAGRKEIQTKRVASRADIFPFIQSEIGQDHRCYVVCPAIEDDEEGKLISIDAIKKEYEKYFGPENISIVNGKMKKNEIAAEMDKFVQGITKILISTTVIEVGVNVPEATVMVVEQADRFGLASLHQLRGRVGRSDLQSYCFLISEDSMNERLRTLVRTNDGFEIAEADMLLRGTGNLIGTEQSGFNRYVEEMISKPELYRFAQNLAHYCLEKGYGSRLIEMYTEKPEEKK